MSWTSLVDRLAGAAGLEPWYYDLAGVKHETTLESKVLVLSALGLDVSSVAAARASLARVDEEPWRTPLAPCIVTRARSPEIDLFLPANAAQKIVTWRMELESGERPTHEFRAESLPLLAARDIDGERVEHRRLFIGAQPAGYHRVAIASDEETRSVLALTPDAAYLPPRLAAGERVWGVAAHLYTLRSETDWGIGDFSALARLCSATGRARGSAIALNPFHALFPSRPEDASPYSPSSRLFLNPIYIDIGSEVASRQVPQIDALAKSAAHLRASELIDYPEVWRAKLAGFEALFAMIRQQPEAAEFTRFVAAGGEALQQFALFSALSEHGVDWRKWPLELRSPATATRAADSRAKERAAFHRYLQFLADGQLRQAAEHASAAQMEIGLVRDLALGISPDGADAWMRQDAYVSELRCGAPPDDFQPLGQEWGVLPLDPLRLRRNPAAFIELVRANMRHAGGLRIDHIIGLQRQFLVPLDADARAGCYIRFPFDDLLGLLALESHRSRCLVVGEDLGTVPEGFRPRIHDMNIPGSAVLYFERTQDGGFRPPQEYGRKTVATASTHDLIPLAGYLEKCDVVLRQSLGIYSADEAKAADAQRDVDRARLLEALLARAGIPVAAEDATAALSRAVHAFLASSSAQLFLAKLDDLLCEREPLNVPGTTTQVPNWRRKLSAGVDDAVLVDAIAELASICRAHGRTP
jgi:4-alpha-glucanotransferase